LRSRSEANVGIVEAAVSLAIMLLLQSVRNEGKTK